ncbi:MAG: HD domain-containing protein [Acidobacteriota bacterium]
MTDLRTIEDALALLSDLGAPPRLRRHGQLVSEAAEEIVTTLREKRVDFDHERVLLGAVLHDAGKIEHPAELDGPGNRHEPDGERLLLSHDVPPDLARCCRTHADWGSAEAELEDRLIALADKLWKGKRVEELELAVIDEVAGRLGQERWDLFVDLDGCFERIAAEGERRLERSRT